MGITINGKEYADGTKHMYNPKTGTYDILAPGADTSGYLENNPNTFLDPNVNKAAHSGINQDEFNKWYSNYSQNNNTSKYGDGQQYDYKDGNLVSLSQPNGLTRSAGNNTYSTPQGQFDIRSEMEKLKAAQLASVTAGLDKQKAGALSNLSAEQAKIQPMAIADRNKANISMNNVNKSWSDFLAAKGLNQSGSAALGTGLNQAQYLGNVGSINRDATNKEADILRRTTDVNNNYLSDLEAARAGIETNYLNRRIEQMNADRDFNYKVDRNTIDDNRYDTEYQDSRSDTKFNQDRLTNQDSTVSLEKQKQDYISTIGQFYDNYQAEINKLEAIDKNDWRLPYLRAARQEKVAAQEAEKKAYLKSIQVAYNAELKQEYDNAMAIWKEKGVADENIAQILGINVGDKTTEYIKNEAATKISQQNANAATKNSETSFNNSRLASDKFEWEKTNVANGLNPDGTKIKPDTAYLKFEWEKKNVLNGLNPNGTKIKPDTSAQRLAWEQANVQKGLNPNGTPRTQKTENDTQAKINQVISDLTGKLPVTAYKELKNNYAAYVEYFGSVDVYNKVLKMYESRIDPETMK